MTCHGFVGGTHEFPCEISWFNYLLLDWLTESIGFYHQYEGLFKAADHQIDPDG